MGFYLVSDINLSSINVSWNISGIGVTTSSFSLLTEEAFWVNKIGNWHSCATNNAMSVSHATSVCVCPFEKRNRI